MKRFLILIAVFFALVAVVDVCCGFGFDYLKSHAKGGETYKHYYIAEKCEADVLILGSSRAARHYVPSIIEDSLGLSCYNAGEPGCGIIPAYAYYKMVAERHKPKLVIYDLYPEYDYYDTDDYSKYLGRLGQIKNKESVQELYSIFGDKFLPIRMISNMYRNNPCVVGNILDVFSFSKQNDNGYEPLYGKLTSISLSCQSKQNSELWGLDTLKLNCVEELVIATINDNVPLLFFISPRFLKLKNEEHETFNEAYVLAEKYSLPLIDCSTMKEINGKMEFFQDFGHMNDNGARLYTKEIISELTKYLK